MNSDRCALGVDLGGTNVRAAVVREDGKLLGVTKHRHPGDDRRPEPVADSVRTACEGALAEARREPTSVTAVGVGVAGQIHAGTGVVAVGPNLGWRQVPFKALLQQRLRWPVLLLNDLAAAAWGEHSVGAGLGAVDSAAVFVGSGIGCGLVIDGDLYEGSDGVAGELGHIKVVPGGRLCGCGEHGCLEAYCGGATSRRAWPKGWPRVVRVACLPKVRGRSRQARWSGKRSPGIRSPANCGRSAPGCSRPPSATSSPC